MRAKTLQIMRGEKEKAKAKGDRKEYNRLKRFDLEEEQHNQTQYYSFTGVVESMTARLYFLSRDNFETFCRYIGNDLIKQEIEKRMDLLQQ